MKVASTLIVCILLGTHSNDPNQWVVLRGSEPSAGWSASRPPFISDSIYLLQHIDSHGGAIASIDDFKAWVTGPQRKAIGKALKPSSTTLWTGKEEAVRPSRRRRRQSHFTRKPYNFESEPFNIKGQEVLPKKHVKILGLVMDAKIKLQGTHRGLRLKASKRPSS